MKFVLIFLTFSFVFSCKRKQSNDIISLQNDSGSYDKSYNEAVKKRQQWFAHEAQQWCASHHYNQRFFFLADLSLPGGRKRLFVYDMKTAKVIAAGLVAHGCCNSRFLSTARFSNAPGCGCSSLGKYKIGGKYRGSYGTSYRLTGLDSANSNAAMRNIVLHSYYSMPDEEVYPNTIGNSYGCVMISKAFLKTVELKIDSSSKPILLWVTD